MGKTSKSSLKAIPRVKPRRLFVRWGVLHKVNNVILGRYLWKDGNTNEIPIRTFRTREQARTALKTMCCYRVDAKVVKVNVEISIA